MKSWEVMKWAFKQVEAKGPAKLVLVNLAFHYNELEKAAWPGLCRIRCETGLKLHTIIGALGKLKDLNLIEKATREGAHGQNRYTLKIPPETGADFGVSRFAENGNSTKKVGLPVSVVGLPETAVVGLPETADKPLSKPLSKNSKERVRGKPSPSKGTDPRVKDFFVWWGNQYQKRFQGPYHFNGGKEGALIKSALRSYGLDKLKELALRFLDSDDPWVKKTGGYTIGVFISQLNKLISTATAKQTQSRGVKPQEGKYAGLG